MAAQGLVEALAGNEALSTLAEAEAWPDKFISSTQAHSPNMYSTCILAFQIDRNSASGTELNNLKQIRSGTITSDTGSMQRVGGPVAHYACRLPTDTTGVRAGLVRRACPLDNQGNDS